jgi:hypothetical protein
MVGRRTRRSAGRRHCGQALAGGATVVGGSVAGASGTALDCSAAARAERRTRARAGTAGPARRLQSRPAPRARAVPHPVRPATHRAPRPRWAHAAAAVGSLLFAYGGVGQVVLDDLAVLDVDLMTWRALKPRAPAPRDRPGKLHAAAMAATGHVLWLFGGQQGRKFLRELYALDTDAMAWALAAPGGTPPAARAGHTLTAVEGVGVFCFGGQGKRLFEDLHVLEVHALGFTLPAPPRPDAGGALSACSTSSAGSSSAASGASGGSGRAGASGAPHCEWVELKPRGKGPSPRRGHSLTWDGKDQLICFGGSTSNSTDNGLWVYSIPHREWRPVVARGVVPPPRTHHSAVLLRPGQLLVFGGCNAQGVFFQVRVAPARGWRSSRRRGLKVCGAPNGSGLCNRREPAPLPPGPTPSTPLESLSPQDAYLLDLSTFTWCRPVALGALPAARYHHSCTRAGRRVVLYGGINPRQAFDGVVLIESGTNLGSELTAVADELCRMSVSSAASDGGASSAVGASAGVSSYNYGGALGGGGGSVHGSSAYGGGGGAGHTGSVLSAGYARAPSAPPSLAGSLLGLPHHHSAGAAGGAMAAAAAGSSPREAPPAPNGRGGAGGAGPSTSAPTTGGPQSLAGASTDAGSSLGLPLPVLSGDLMKLQLRDLLVKRHLEDLQISSARRAEELLHSLEQERREKAALQKELLQARLVCAEAEERARAQRRRADDAAVRAARDGADADAARVTAAEAGAAAAALEQRLEEAHVLLNSVSRELGLLSSRHHRLRLEHAALQCSRERAQARERAALAVARGGGGAAPEGQGGATAVAAEGEGSEREEDENQQEDQAEKETLKGSGSGRASMDDAGPAAAGAPPEAPATGGTSGDGGAFAPGAATCQHVAAAASCLLCAVHRYLAATQQLLAAGSATDPSAPLPAAGAAAGPAGPPNAGALREQLAAARAALAKSEAARAAAEREACASAAAAAEAAADAAEVRADLSRLGGDRLALAACSASELRELEARLDAAGRVVRALVVERTVSEMQRRSSAEGALCTVCMERRKGLVFNCGHQTCAECGEHMATCPFCRVDITARIRLFQS